MKKVRIVLLLSVVLLMAMFVSNCSVTVGWPFSWLGGPWAVTFDWGFLLSDARDPDPEILNFSTKVFTIDGVDHAFEYQMDNDGNITINVGDRVLTGVMDKTSPKIVGTADDGNGFEAVKQ
jgi:hypothetical protein